MRELCVGAAQDRRQGDLVVAHPLDLGRVALGGDGSPVGRRRARAAVRRGAHEGTSGDGRAQRQATEDLREAYPEIVGLGHEPTFTGTRDGILQTSAEPIAPTGRRVAVDYIQVLCLRDGRHTAFHLSFDRLAMLEQLGLVPAAVAD